MYSGFSKLSQIRVTSRSGRYLFTSGCQIRIHTMGKYYCCMPECHNFKGKTGKYGKSVTLHKLPSNISTRRAWIRAISRKNWKPTAYTRVCSDHFEDGIGPCYFTRNKVPTVNLAQKPLSASGKKERIRRHVRNNCIFKTV